MEISTNQIKKIIVLSQSAIKKKAINDVFGDKYEIDFVDVPDNLDRESQPLFIDGTKEACNQRINEYFKKHNKLDQNTLLISIENGIMPVDGDITQSAKFCDRYWCDFCLIGILEHASEATHLMKEREFIISPEMILIDQKYSEIYFSDFYKKNTSISTLGKYISHVSGNVISHNNWMKDVSGIDRVDQIKRGLRHLFLYKKLKR